MEKIGFNVSNIPLNNYRNRSFYTMRTDALDRFGTKLEQRFSRDQIKAMMEKAGLERIRFSPVEPFWCAVGYGSRMEDTDATPEELERQFGAGVAGIVAEVTDDPTLTRAARKQAQIDHAPRLSKPAMLVKLADKLCNVTDILERPPDWPQWRKDEYVRWAREVVEALRGTNSALESKFDEVADRRE